MLCSRLSLLRVSLDNGLGVDLSCLCWFSVDFSLLHSLSVDLTWFDFFSMNFSCWLSMMNLSLWMCCLRIVLYLNWWLSLFLNYCFHMLSLRLCLFNSNLNWLFWMMFLDGWSLLMTLFWALFRLRILNLMINLGNLLLLNFLRLMNLWFLYFILSNLVNFNFLSLLVHRLLVGLNFSLFRFYRSWWMNNFCCVNMFLFMSNVMLFGFNRGWLLMMSFSRGFGMFFRFLFWFMLSWNLFDDILDRFFLFGMSMNFLLVLHFLSWRLNMILMMNFWLNMFWFFVNWFWLLLLFFHNLMNVLNLLLFLYMRMMDFLLYFVYLSNMCGLLVRIIYDIDDFI